MSNSRSEEDGEEVVNSTNNEEQVGAEDAGKIKDETSSEIIGLGLSRMITSVIADFDEAALSTCNSQLVLSSSLDRLTSELDQLLEDAPLPFIMQHAAKLSNVRKRVSSLNSVLKTIQRRLDNIDRMLSVGTPNDQTNIGGSE